MSLAEIMHEIDTLPAPERWQVLEHTRHTLEPEIPDELPQWQKDELDRRAAEFACHPETGIPWERAKQLILAAA